MGVGGCRRSFGRTFMRCLAEQEQGGGRKRRLGRSMSSDPVARNLTNSILPAVGLRELRKPAMAYISTQ